MLTSVDKLVTWLTKTKDLVVKLRAREYNEYSFESVFKFNPTHV